RPSGWRFMDKFIQLPFTIPQCERSGIEGYVRLLLPHEKADSTGASSTTEVPKPLEENDQVPSNPRDVRVLAYSACARALNSVSSSVRALFTPRSFVQPVNAAASLALILVSPVPPRSPKLVGMCGATASPP